MADLCRRGDRCRNRHPATGDAAEASPRGLCLPCERHGQFVIAQSPATWLTLSTRIGREGGGFGAGIPAVKASEAPIPLRVDIDEAMRHIAWTLETWEIEVRRTARLSPLAKGRVRPHVVVLRAAGLLSNHYSALLALGPTDHVEYGGDIAVADGVEAIGEMMDVHYRSHMLIGDTRRRERRRLPCPPYEDGGCGMSTLGEWIGDGPHGERIVDCTNCGWQCTIEQYTTYATAFIPPGRKAAA